MATIEKRQCLKIDCVKVIAYTLGDIIAEQRMETIEYFKKNQP